MTPVLQLDPLSLVIWMAPGSFGGDAAGQSAVAALRAAWEGGNFVAAAQSHASTLEEAKHAAWIGSCMWHEKRHFFDICLTSYGAWRLRNMFVIAAHAMAVGGHAKQSGEPLALPITAYIDPVRRRLMGLAEPADNVRRIAEDIQRRKRALFRESSPLLPSRSAMRMDGTAQMEGLALLSQFHCLAKTYGSNPASELYSEHVNGMDPAGLYRWIEAVSRFLGCRRERQDGIIELDHEFATALLVGGLCGRWLGKVDDPSAVTPSERLGRLIHELGPKAGHFGMTTAEASERVDDLALQIWGRRLWQELEADLEESAKVGEMLRREFGNMGELCEAFDDYLALRRRMLDEVKAIGPTAMSPRAFGANWADRLRPRLLEVATHGRSYDPEDTEFRVHFGRTLRHPDLAPMRFAWAWRSGEAADDPAKSVGFHDTAAWDYVVEQAAPMAKLALAGRQHELMLYPELERILSDIREAGVEIRFAAGFEWPEERDLAGRRRAALSYARLTRQESFVCDITGDRIAVSDAALLTPWEFRRSPLVARFRDRSAHFPLLAEVKLEQDWSDWIVRADLAG